MKKLPMLTKSFLGFSFFLAIPLIILGIIFYYNLVNYTKKEISKSSIINLQNVKKLNDQLVDSITKQAIRLSLDAALQDIGGINDYFALKNNPGDMIKLSRVYQILTETANINYRIKSIYFFMEKNNYLITSNHGYELKSDFTDTGWLNDYEKSKDMGAGTLWLNSRPDNDRKQDPNNTSFVLTFILPLKTLRLNYDGAIVVNLYERELYNLMNDSGDKKDGYVIIINNQGTVVSYPDKRLITRNIAGRAYINDILHSGNDTGYIIGNMEHKEYMFSYYKSDFNNWIYIGVMSMNDLIGKTAAIRNSIILLLLGLMIAGSVFTYFFSRAMYNPVKKLMSDIQKRKGIDFKTMGNEMAILSRVFDSMIKQEDSLSNTLEKSRQALKNKFLTDLFKGGLEEESRDRQYEGEFPYPYFICAVIAIDKYDGFSEKYSNDQQYYMKHLILKTCCEVANDKYKITGVLYEKSKIALIINCEEYDQESNRTTLSSNFGALQNEVAKVLSNPITIGVGSCYKNIENISLSFNEAQEALKSRIVRGSGSIIFHSCNEIENKYYYPYRMEKHILNLLQLGSGEEVILALKDLIEEIKRRKGISPDNVEQIFIQLVGNTVKYLVELNINIRNIFGSGSNVFHELSTKENLEEIYTWLTGFYSGIIQFMSNAAALKTSPADIVMDYIHKNFKLNIDTTAIADNTGVGYSSVGRIIRSKTGKNVLEYINGLRIEEAKRLLKSTTMNIKDIAVNVGYNNDQSFARFFKKYEGLTPGEFRNLG